jgi:hydroxyacylglutathione hydrolase
MKRNVKRVLLAVGVLIIVLITYLGIIGYRFWSDMKGFATLATGPITPGVCAIRDSYVNLYLFKGNRGFIAVDSGFHPESVRKELLKLHIDPSSVAAVFLTHSDRDHVGGLSVFQNAKIYLSREEEQMIDGRTRRFPFFANQPIPKHDSLQDNQTVEADGFKVTAALTPGHTPGAMCYLVNGQFLVVGDSMRLTEGKAEIFSKTINMDSAMQLQSLKKLAKLEGVKYVLTAHFGHTDSFEKALKPLALKD